MRPRLLSQLDGKSSHYPRTALHQHDAAFYRPGHVHGAMGRNAGNAQAGPLRQRHNVR